MGLGQLHQLRGRVGRSEQRVTPTSFTHPQELTEKAFERLRTIGEATQLGSGFRIAMRDLEIRGAGNLSEAPNQVYSSIGYDLYCEMAPAVAELKGDPINRTPEVDFYQSVST